MPVFYINMLLLLDDKQHAEFGDVNHPSNAFSHWVEWAIRIPRDFKTITDAINYIHTGNTKRVIVYIGGANYNEKIKIERTMPFMTLYGAPGNMPNLTFGGTAEKYGTVDSATLIVESDCFVAANIIISICNLAPRPDGERSGAQAVALRISGDKAAFYNCKLFGF
ncbi:putative pectinesterase 63 [Gastrolobium bilobum]|uniref:putative pectinesterase 63 n=1 Tax=Gastrolobium bilobum TaxID=150636 RepID=UPI002AB1C5CC|nr:putative pectinesterase 63 [Gastrolobium bilobum]